MRQSTQLIQNFLKVKGNSIYDVESVRKGMAIVAQAILDSDEDRLSSSGYSLCKDCADLNNANI